IYGALSVFYRRQREFAATDVELLEAFGTQASAALENGRAFGQLAVKARHDEALHDFSQRLLGATGEEAIRQDALRLTRELRRAASATTNAAPSPASPTRRHSLSRRRACIRSSRPRWRSCSGRSISSSRPTS